MPASLNSDHVERICNKFYRPQEGDHVRAGTGISLAIARGFVEPLRGTIAAANRIDGSGAAMTITLPIPIGTKTLETAA
jgi:two-component system, OmpR family, sensor histidine kinase KdpD